MAVSSRATSSRRTSSSPARCSKPSAPRSRSCSSSTRWTASSSRPRRSCSRSSREYQVSIPELGTVRATQLPMVFLTSNNTRELSEALKRRCLYLHIDYPDLEREREIVRAKVPGISEELADQVARIVRSLRTIELRKAPSVSETLDWARTLVLLGVQTIDAAGARHAPHLVEVPGRHRAGGQGTALGELSLARPSLGLRHRAAPLGLAGVVDRAPRRRRGGQAHPARGPRGPEVRAGRDPGQVVLALARLRDGVRGVLRRAHRGGRGVRGPGRGGRRPGEGTNARAKGRNRVRAARGVPGAGERA